MISAVNVERVTFWSNLSPKSERYHLPIAAMWSPVPDTGSLALQCTSTHQDGSITKVVQHWTFSPLRCKGFGRIQVAEIRPFASTEAETERGGLEVWLMDHGVKNEPSIYLENKFKVISIKFK